MHLFYDIKIDLRRMVSYKLLVLDAVGFCDKARLITG